MAINLDKSTYKCPNIKKNKPHIFKQTFIYSVGNSKNCINYFINCWTSNSILAFREDVFYFYSIAQILICTYVFVTNLDEHWFWVQVTIYFLNNVSIGIISTSCHCLHLAVSFPTSIVTLSSYLIDNTFYMF